MDSTRIVTASGFGESRRTVTRRLYQYDYGQVLRFDLELPQAYEVHFALTEYCGTSITQIGNADGVNIPDSLLTEGKKIYAWVYLHEGADDGETRYTVEIPVNARPEITNQEPTPVQQDAITEAIAALNVAVEQTSQDAESASASAESAARSAASIHEEYVELSGELSGLEEEITHYLSLESDDAESIQSGANFNNYTTPGNYCVKTIAISETISNIPYQTSGRLTVARTTQSDRIIQIYWCNSTYILIYYRMCIGGTWSEWAKFVNTSDLNAVRTEVETNADTKVALATLRDIYPASNGQVKFEREGTNITVTLPRSLVHYLNTGGSMIERSVSNGTTVTVPHDSFCIYNIKSSAIESKTLSELMALGNTSYVVLFYNSSGNVHGLFEKYSISQRINSEADVFFYGYNIHPTFSFLGDYSIDVTLPANARVNYYDLSAALFRNGAWTNVVAQTINVPHDKCLVYDITTKNISIEDYNFNYDQNKTVLFYNSHGIVNGQWYRYYLLQLFEEQKNGYPAYFSDYLKTQLDTINILLMDYGTSGMVFITDHHYPNNTMKSVGIAETVCKQTGINKVFLGGDYINRETQKAEALRNINRIAGMYEYPSVKTFRMCGNHEFNNPGASSDPAYLANELSSAELRHAILNTFISDVVCDSNSLSYYYDDEINKIRYFIGSVTRSSSLDAASVKWVCDQLLLVPSGYSIVVMFHTILSYSNGVTSLLNSASNLVGVLDALKAKTSYTFDGTTYDFSTKDTDLICAICADMHVDTDYTTAGGVHIIATTTDSMQELGGLSRTVGEISEVAFDVFIFDTAQRVIHCIRIGAGQDRMFTY